MKLAAILMAMGMAMAAPQTSGPEANVNQRLEQTPFYLQSSINNFNSKLFSQLAKSQSGNFIYSPMSLHMLLSMIYVGAPVGTETSKELGNLLGFESSRNEDYLYNYLKIVSSQTGELELANGMFVGKNVKILPNFATALNIFYKATVDSVDFDNPPAAVDVINRFVSQKTRGLINGILNSRDVSSLTKLVLVNAIYFKGNWQTRFDIKNTKQMTFNVDRFTQVPFDAMQLKADMTVIHSDKLNADVLEIPYENKQLSMLILLPSDNIDVRSVEAKLDSTDVTNFIRDLDRFPSSSVDLVLPKFETEFDWQNLQATLKNLGISTMFDEAKADLSDISDDPVFVSRVAHKAVVKVNEEGTEAAAVSAGVITTRNEFMTKEIRFVVDKPFLFYIVDKKLGLPIFAGRIVDPSGNHRLE